MLSEKWGGGLATGFLLFVTSELYGSELLSLRSGRFALLNNTPQCIIINTEQYLKYINQPDATTSQVYYLMFMHSSTCFGRPHAHQQELNNCNSSLWFFRLSVVVAGLLVVVGPAGRSARPRTTALLPPRSNGKTRGSYCSC